MNRSAIEDQNNDNIVGEPQDILEEDVEDDDDNNNDVAHMDFINKKPKILLYLKILFFFYISFNKALITAHSISGVRDFVR